MTSPGLNQRCETGRGTSNSTIVNILAYDLHGTSDAYGKIAKSETLYQQLLTTMEDFYVEVVIGGHTTHYEIGSALNLLWSNAINPAKVVFGLGFYGQNFT
jgi:GH18 family chitinase